MAHYSRCKNCGGEQTFKPEKGVLVCERCGGSAPVKEGSGGVIKRMYSPTYSPSDNLHTSVKYRCATCGTSSVVGTDGEVKRCSSCGNTSLTKETSKTHTPDGIIPFEIARDKAAEIFRKWVGSRKFAPSDLKEMAKLQKISGLYTPIWNFSFNSTMRYTCVGVRVRVDSKGQAETNEYPLDKMKDTAYSNVIISGSSRISDTCIEGLGEYDFIKLRPYSTDYLLGFAGIDTDVDVHNEYNKMTNEISKDNERKAKNKLDDSYDRVESFLCRTRFRDVVFNYAYVPIWANHYTYNGKEYHCYINGQTGKATGSAPKSAGKIAGLVFGILAAIAAVALIIVKVL